MPAEERASERSAPSSLYSDPRRAGQSLGHRTLTPKQASSPVPPPSRLINKPVERDKVPLKPPQPHIIPGTYQHAWLAGSPWLRG